VKLNSTIIQLVFSLAAGLLLVFGASSSVADDAAAADSQKSEKFKVFHLSRGFSNLFTEDPRRVDMGALERMGLPKPQLIYTSRGYSNAIYSYPQPIADHVSEDPEIVYVDVGYGQAIYSYPSNVGRVYIIGLPQEVR
jgi:hypothetical protein